MITYKFFVDYLKMTETQAKAQYDKIKNDKFKAVQGTLRLNADTILQKFEYYTKELGFSVAEILEDFRLISYDTVSEEATPSPTEDDPENMKVPIKAKVKFYKEELGLDNEQIRVPSLLAYNPDSVRAKVAFLKKTFGFDNSHIKTLPNILNYDTETLQAKADFYKKYLGFTSKQFKDFPNLITFDCDENSTKPTAMINKIKFYQDTLGLKESHFKAYPCILSYDTVSDESVPTSVRGKIKFYHDTLGFTEKQFQKNVCILNYDTSSDENTPTSIQSKIKFYRDVFGFENKQFQSDPGVLGYDCSESGAPTSVLEKFKFYQQYVGLTKKHIKENTILLHLDCEVASDKKVQDSNQAEESEESKTSVMAKLEKIYEIGLTNEDIQANTKLLLTPAQDLKPKYALWSIIFPDKCFMNLPTWFITRIEKVYARYQYFLNDYPLPHLKPNDVERCESQFIKRYKQNSEYLMQKYPFSDEIMAQIFEEYKKKGILPEIQKEQ